MSKVRDEVKGEDVTIKSPRKVSLVMKLIWTLIAMVFTVIYSVVIK